MPTNDTTIDGVRVKQGLLVWDYDLRPAVVGEVDHIAQDGTAWYSTTAPDGSRRGLFDAKRMWRYHPTTGRKPEPASHEEMVAALDRAQWTILPDDRAAVAHQYARLTEGS